MKFLPNSSDVKLKVVASSLQCLLNFMARSEIFSLISLTLLRVSSSRCNPFLFFFQIISFIFYLTALHNYIKILNNEFTIQLAL